jgi:hypothetical protein
MALFAARGSGYLCRDDLAVCAMVRPLCYAGAFRSLVRRRRHDPPTRSSQAAGRWPGFRCPNIRPSFLSSSGPISTRVRRCPYVGEFCGVVLASSGRKGCLHSRRSVLAVHSRLVEACANKSRTESRVRMEDNADAPPACDAAPRGESSALECGPKSVDPSARGTTIGRWGRECIGWRSNK